MECGIEHVQEGDFCSYHCWAKIQQREDRAVSHNAFIHHVYIQELYIRDRGICQYCLEPVELRGGDQDSRISLDHIVPLADGGLHCVSNCQITHWRCNQDKNIVEIHERWKKKKHQEWKQKKKEWKRRKRREKNLNKKSWRRDNYELLGTRHREDFE